MTLRTKSRILWKVGTEITKGVRNLDANNICSGPRLHDENLKQQLIR